MTRVVRAAAAAMLALIPAGLLATGHILAALMALASYGVGWAHGAIPRERLIGRLLAAVEGLGEGNHQLRMSIADHYRQARQRFRLGLPIRRHT